MRENNHPVAFDAEGNLRDQVTGEEGRLTTPEVIVTPNGKPISYRYSTAFDGSLDNFMEVTNALTGGMANRLSPTQNIRLLYDTATGGDWRSSWMGNNGIVTDKFAEEHPYLSMAANGLLDLAVPVMGVKGVPKAKAMAAKAVDEGLLWDKYTTFGGRFGNWGDTMLDKIWGTTARRFGLPDKARVPADAM